MTAGNRSQVWFRPGRWVPVSYVRGAEVLSYPRRGGVHLGNGTIHGTAAELRALAIQLLAAAKPLDEAAEEADEAA